MMSKPVAKSLKSPSADHRARCLPVRIPSGLAGFGALASCAVRARRVEHRNGAGHLDPTYEAGLRSRAQDHARTTGERAFVSGTSSANASAEEAGEEFVFTVTSGNGHSASEDTNDERGGPFVQTSGSVEFAYDTDESNPVDATREPFPRS